MKSYHMEWDEFRTVGKDLIDWIADYHEQIESRPVKSQAHPGEIRAALPDAPPGEGEQWSRILEDLDRHILPGVTHWQSPNFFAFFPANTSGPSILGELLSAGLAVQGMLWETSPACTELETHVLDWLVDMLGLPERFRANGVIHDSASSASLCAILAARERAIGDLPADGYHEAFGKLRLYATAQTHSSVEKGARIAGLTGEQLRRIEVDENYAMKPESLAEAIEDDRKSGHIPFFVCATVGTTSSTAIDPVERIAEQCDGDRPPWLHVDAALAGTAAVCEEFRDLQRGIERADSYCFNPHKWMFTNFDCDCFYVADRGALLKALSILPEYLRNRASESDSVIDYRDWQIPLGRRFRALKLWFVIRHYGVKGIRHHVRRHVELARSFAEWVRADDEFELLVEPPLNLVCFRHRDGDRKTEAIEHAINDSGRAYLTHTKLGDRYTLRLSVGQTSTEYVHVERVWKLLKETAASV